MIAFRVRVVALASSAMAALASGCFHPSYDRPTCGPQGECPGGLTCSEPLHVCLGNGGTGGDDAGVDAPVSDTPPGVVCYGPSGWQVCLDAAPSASIALPGFLDTDRSGLCLKNQPASWTAALQPDACFVVGDTVTVTSLATTGNRPLVIVARSQINVMGLLDIASHRLNGTAGAGSLPTDCQPFGSNPGNGPPNGGGGGGAGGSFMFPGADGGAGDGVNHQGGQAADADIGAPPRLRGGCPGQPGNGGKPTDGGAGGGAVYLVSAGEISIPGKIDASGAGGGGGDAAAGGSGGGSGGSIILFASSITTAAATVLIVNGGGGGGGGSTGPAKGANGEDPSFAVPIVAARGGAGGILVGGTGGDGGNGFASVAAAHVGLSSDTAAGGGGGGGGGGYIQSNQDLGSATVSPTTTIKP